MGLQVLFKCKLVDLEWNGVETFSLEIFWCVFYSYINSNACRKLDVKSRKYFFIDHGMSHLATVFGIIGVRKLSRVII